MVKKEKNSKMRLSYESDGKMGKVNFDKSKNGKQKEFFNITQESE
jgi:hypothetical protein